MTVKPFAVLFEAILDLLFPPCCEICRTLQEPVLCAECREQFNVIGEPMCRQCGLPLDPLAKTTGHCTECNTDPPPFDIARAGGIYDGMLRQSIHVFKYEMIRALASPLGQFLAETIVLPFPVDCLCPVPLHPARERMRGFNQSMLLATYLSEQWELPVEADLLVRTQNTTPQMLLPREQRRQNIKGAFMAGRSCAGHTVALIDDVYTTGSTLRECSHVLKRAGAERVAVITVARAV